MGFVSFSGGFMFALWVVRVSLKHYTSSNDFNLKFVPIFSAFSLVIKILVLHPWFYLHGSYTKGAKCRTSA